MPTASTINPQEREFVVDSGASMHMVSKKDLNKAELETVRISKNPTVVMTANGEVRAKEQTTVYGKEFDLFVTVNTPAVLSPGKLCEDHGYIYHWTSGQTTSHQTWQENQLQHCEVCTIRCPGFIDKFFYFILTYFNRKKL